jgi:hypothetical protein
MRPSPIGARGLAHADVDELLVSDEDEPGGPALRAVLVSPAGHEVARRVEGADVPRHVVLDDLLDVIDREGAALPVASGRIVGSEIEAPNMFVNLV